MQKNQEKAINMFIRQMLQRENNKKILVYCHFLIFSEVTNEKLHNEQG